MSYWCAYSLYCSCMARNRTGDLYHNVAGKRDNPLSMQHILFSYALFNQINQAFPGCIAHFLQ